MSDTILFLFLSCIFMLFNNIIYIIVNTCTCNNPRLLSSIHRKSVNIITLVIIRYIYAVCHHTLKNFFCLVINLRHLSKENNTPMLALQTVFSTLGTAGVVPDKDCIVQTQRRNEVSPALAF